MLEPKPVVIRPPRIISATRKYIITSIKKYSILYQEQKLRWFAWRRNMFSMRLHNFKVVIRKLLSLWLELFTIFLIMLRIEATILWDYGFMAALLEKLRDTKALDMLLKVEDTDRKQIFAKSKSFFMKNLKNNFSNRSAQENVLLV